MQYSNLALVRAIAYYSLGEQLVENVWTLRTRNAGIPDSEIAVTFRNEIVRRLFPVQSEDLTCDRVTVQELFPQLSDPYELAVGEQGAHELPSVPTSVAGVAAMQSGLGGRRNRGRKYMAGIPKAHVNTTSINPDVLPNWQGQLDLIEAFFAIGNNLSNLDLGILHRTDGGQPVVIGAGSFVRITNLIMRPTLGTMRSRLKGHGA